ncbi:MAG: putative DNA binding domain-containing protein [Armatimonadetes bacterium]|nr:putative DNA binding domain-containing protein [Armatimonadota bacterium]
MAEQHNPTSGIEGQNLDRKSLRTVMGRTADFAELAKDCVCFANGSGGRILIGVEDDATEPPSDQRVPPDLLDRIRKRVGELTVNVDLAVEVQTSAAGGEYVVLTIPRAVGVASTSDGRYFLRVGEDCRPVVGDDVLRLVTERPSVPWETMTSLEVPRNRCDTAKGASLCAALRGSDRVKSSVREKGDNELLDHYGLASSEVLTNLGVLLLGTSADRARLGTAPVVQAIKYDERGVKVAKNVWDDHALSPVELVDAVWQGIPDFRESYELPDGLLRTRVPAYEEAVVRELLVNALVHRPYTQRGDVFLNLHPDRLEVVNAGRLPLGVTPRNILHASRRRNDGLARVFHDLKLMEREGSGFDLLYDRLLTSGRAAPTVSEGVDSVHVVVPRRVVHPGVIRLIADADQRHQLTQRERIALGLLGQSEGMSAAELLIALELPDTSALRPWTSRLVELGLVHTVGRTRATRYFVEPALLRNAGLDAQTTLKRIQPHRLRALILEDLARYPGSSSSEIHSRVGPEIPTRTFLRTLTDLLDDGQIEAKGERRWRRYSPASSIGQGDDDGR